MINHSRSISTFWKQNSRLKVTVIDHSKRRNVPGVIEVFVPPYEHKVIESKWQKCWEEKEIYTSRRSRNKEKKYILDMFPYPSGSGLHVGHVKGYSITDIMARYYRMKGFDVLHPIGWDAFGLPAEQYAIKTGTHPSVTTAENIKNFRRQLKALGFSYDWRREFSTTDPNYLKWTQWIFLQLFKKGLAFQNESLVNWCPKLGTVLANEEVINGLSERGNHPVVRLPLRQWSLRISQYGDKLLEGLESLQWPKGTIQEQKQWIKKSSGAIIRFQLDLRHLSQSSSPTSYVEIFTTKPHTLMGVTYLVLAPEHKLIPELTIPSQLEAVTNYQQEVACKKDLERIGNLNTCGKTGVALGSYAIHPITKERLPIWTSDYVLSNVGTGIVMGVPAHNTIDYAFAQCFNLPCKVVIRPPDGPTNTELSLPYCEEDGILINSSNRFNSLSIPEGRKQIIEYLQQENIGYAFTSFFNNREWTFSRQRYWGEPIPIYFPVEILPNSEGLSSPLENAPHIIRYDQPIAVDESELPLLLPHMSDFQPLVMDDATGNCEQTPEGCLGRIKTWKYFQRSNDPTRWYARETNTMPQWAGSCWYYLRFTDPQNEQQLISPEADQDWLPVDLYVGGQEHAVLHLLYARFWHHVLYDLGIVKDKEPFQRLLHQGIILGHDHEKMSKSRGNIVSVDEIIHEYGADLLRMYQMLLCPLEGKHSWSIKDMIALIRFRNRIYYLLKRGWNIDPLDNNDDTMDPKLRYLIHKTIKDCTYQIEQQSFSELLPIWNRLSDYLLEKNSFFPKRAYEVLLLMIAPFAPHLAEECWALIGNSFSIHQQTWPSYREEYCFEDTVMLPIQINGKKRMILSIEKHLVENREEIIDYILNATNSTNSSSELISLQEELKQCKIRKVIYIPGKIINFVL